MAESRGGYAETFASPVACRLQDGINIDRGVALVGWTRATQLVGFSLCLFLHVAADESNHYNHPFSIVPTVDQEHRADQCSGEHNRAADS